MNARDWIEPTSSSGLGLRLGFHKPLKGPLGQGVTVLCALGNNIHEHNRDTSVGKVRCNGTPHHPSPYNCRFSNLSHLDGLEHRCYSLATANTHGGEGILATLPL